MWTQRLIIAATLMVAAALTSNQPAAADTVSPDAISDLAFWLNAGDLALTNGDPVSAWADSSGSTTGAAAASGAEPTFIDSVASMNNQAAVRFNGSTQLMTVADQILPTSLSGVTIFAVAQTNEIGDFSVFALRNGSTNPLVQLDQDGSGNVRFILRDGANRTINASSAIAAGTDYGIYSGRLGQSGSTYTGVAGFNGSEGAAASHASINTGSMGDEPQTVGGIDSFGPTAYWNGDIAEVIIYNRELTAFERNLVGFNLAQKYALQTEYHGGVYIDYGESGQNVQTGFTQQDVGAATTTSDIVTTVIDPFGNGNDVDVRLSSGGAGIQGRDRHALSNTDENMNNLVDDLVFNSGFSDLTLTIGDGGTAVEAGRYLFTGYFNDSFFNSSTQSAGLSDLGVAAYIGANDGTPNGTTTVSDFRSSNPTDPLGVIRLLLISDGINPLVVTLEGASVDGRFAFNGFTLTAIPEPASAAMLGVSVLALMRRRNR